MPEIFFDNVFRNIASPVVVCRCNRELDVVYENASAKILLNPLSLSNMGNLPHSRVPLASILRFSPDGFGEFAHLVTQSKNLPDYVSVILSFENETIPVSISSSAVEYMGEDYRALCIYTPQSGQKLSEGSRALLTAFHLSCNCKDTDEAIQSVLSFAGGHTGVSRAYIFEDISPAATSNTYEWCASGIEPVMRQLQNLPKSDYSYAALMDQKLFAADDVRKLSEQDRAVLEAQGIKSLAAVPMFDRDIPLGYVGFDDCERYRAWSAKEISFLRGLAGVLASLLTRRNMERSQLLVQKTLQTVINNNDSIVYVSDIETHELVFINRAAIEHISLDPEQVLGKPCWQVLYPEMDGPCGFCPVPALMTCDASDHYEWERQNLETDRWYLHRDTIIDWIDGRRMHFCKATDITSQKAQEAKLKHIASLDMMTGIYNRAWGHELISRMLSSPLSGGNSLAFIDIDGLKLVNDTYGHNTGDRLILKIIDVIQSHVRKSDVLCRWGGDEFVLILRCASGQAEKIMRNITHKMNEINLQSNEVFKLSFSYGVVALDSGGTQTADSVISAADRLMYKNKMSKRGITI